MWLAVLEYLTLRIIMVVINLHDDIFKISLKFVNKALLRYFGVPRLDLSTSYIRSIYVLCPGGIYNAFAAIF